MPDLTPEEAARWDEKYPGRKWPGDAEPVPGFCGGRLHGRDFKILNITTLRHCHKRAGWNTNHVGYGPCSLHGGSLETVSGKIRKELELAAAEHHLPSLKERLNEPPPLDPAPVEMDRMVRKMKVWFDEVNDRVAELRDYDVLTRDGTSKSHALVEQMERASERMMAALEFAMKYNLEERKVELANDQARAIASAVLAVLMDVRLNLSDKQIEEGRKLLEFQMNKISSQLMPSWMDDDDEIIDAEVLTD